MKYQWLKCGVLALCLAGGGAQAVKPNYCGEIKNAFGPFDYRQAAGLQKEYNLVIGAHFTSDVEQNIKGTSSYVAGDIDYTLRAWPNHPGALAAMSRQSIIEKTMSPAGSHWPVDCYFLRAFQFAPDDGAPHAVYGNHLQAVGKEAQAMEEFKRAVALDPENATINYNAGLAYLKAGNYEKALFHAKKAYEKDFPLPGLRNKLKAAGKWDDKPLAESVVEAGKEK